MSKKSDTEVLISSVDDESSDVELTKEDKDFIFDLVAKEYFIREYSQDLEYTYRCKQKCTVCSENKPNFPSDESLLYELFKRRGEKIVLSWDDRMAINRDLVHNFFKQKWEASNGIVQDQKQTESNRSKEEPRIKRKRLLEVTSTIARMETARETKICKNSKPVDKTDKMMNQQIPPCHSMASISLMKDFNNLRLEPESSGRKPMDDPEGKFFIDREYVDVEMYEAGLRNEHWNPTQSLYEISGKCGWGRPCYTITRVYDKSNTFPRFVCEVGVNGETFMTDKSVAQKKAAQHVASAEVLNYVGFEFDYADKDDLMKSIPLNRLMRTNELYSHRAKLDQENFRTCDTEYGGRLRSKRSKEEFPCKRPRHWAYGMD